MKVKIRGDVLQAYKNSKRQEIRDHQKDIERQREKDARDCLEEINKIMAENRSKEQK